MSILVKSMEMPKSCWACEIRIKCGCKVANASGWLNNKIDDHCPFAFVEVPKHGRLIDADKLERQTCPIKGVSRLKFCGNCDHKFMYVGEVKTTCDEVRYFFLKTITNAPTIIEAEE